jgi:small subunit ribosomal protein S18
MARQQRTGRRKSDRDDRKPKKKVSLLDQESITWVDYKDVNLLRRFMSERAKIRSRRVTGNDAQQQREVARAIRVAREMALLPYSVRQVTHRSKGGKRDRDDRPLRAESDSAPRPSDEAVATDAELEATPTTDGAEEIGAVEAAAGDEVQVAAGDEVQVAAGDEVEEPVA